MALVLTSLLLTVVTTGSLFVKGYITSWSQQERLMSEAAFVGKTIKSAIAGARHLEVFPDSLICLSGLGETTKYLWNQQGFWKNGRQSLNCDVILDSLVISEHTLTGAVGRFSPAPEPACTAYRVIIVVSNGRGDSVVARSLVKNCHVHYGHTWK